MSFNKQSPRRLRSAHSSLAAHGEAWVWLTGGSLAIAIGMITGLLLFITVRGASTFWPAAMELVELTDGRRVLGEITAREEVIDQSDDVPKPISRKLVRTANFEIDGKHYEWFDQVGNPAD